MSLPDGWIANQRPPETATEYDTDPTDTWLGGPEGAQPKTATNPDGTIGSIPVMSITADAAAKLAGDPTK